MRNKSVKLISALCSGFLGLSFLSVSAVSAHEKKDPAIQPSADWMRQAEVMISANAENPGALNFTPIAPAQRQFAIGRKSWTGWVGNIQVQQKESVSKPVVNYACLLSVVEKPPAKKIFANYLSPASKDSIYTIASKAWLKQKYNNEICGDDGKKCMFDNDKLAGAMKAENMSENPVTFVKGKTLAEPLTYVACQAGTIRQ
ncbi:hypothetical protein FAI40_05535 [Acetobacteraceae bacterium]|nr:hypothetical protein FAI40_05535 [Acetobacteraceae bacterium]